MNEEISELLKKALALPLRHAQLWRVRCLRVLMRPWTKGLKRSGRRRLLDAYRNWIQAE
jgi:hypothetical protein